jgi:hypothetical protein
MSIKSLLSEQAVTPVQTISPLPAKKRRVAKTAVTTTKCLSPDAIYIANISVGDTDGGVRTTPETLNSRDTAGTINNIQGLWRMRQRWHRAEKALILQGKALCRSLVHEGDKKLASDLFDKVESGDMENDVAFFNLQPFLMSIQHFRQSRTEIEKKLAKEAKKLPAYDWIKSVHGIGDGGFASIIGECGDISDYKSVSALWKRFGLAVIDGGRQRKVSNVDEAAIHGYSPSRRSVVWNCGTNLIGSLGVGRRPEIGVDLAQYDWPPYQKLFVERCRYLVEKDPEKYGRGTTEKADKTTGEVVLKESYSKHCAASAKRYVEKRFLRDLYAKWNAA